MAGPMAFQLVVPWAASKVVVTGNLLVDCLERWTDSSKAVRKDSLWAEWKDFYLAVMRELWKVCRMGSETVVKLV